MTLSGAIKATIVGDVLDEPVPNMNEEGRPTADTAGAHDHED